MLTAFSRIAGMRSPSSAEPRLVAVTWVGGRGLVPARPALGQLVWGGLLGGSLGLLLVRLIYGWGGPAFIAGPLVALLAAGVGILAGLVAVRRGRIALRPDRWALGIGLTWLLILFRPLSVPAGLAAVGLGLTLLAGRAVGRSTRVGPVPARPAVLAGGVGLTAFLLYWPRLTRHVVPGDSGEFQALIPSLGIPHPTGYPLYVLIGKALTLLPIGEPAFSLSVLAAIFGALSAGFVMLVALDLSRDALAAGLAAGFFALSPIVVQQAVTPEVYAPHLALIAAIIWLLGRCREAAQRRVATGLVALGLGLGLAHHRTIVLVGPAVLTAWLLAGRSTPRPRHLLVWLGLLTAPLLSYLYFVWRWPANVGRPITAEEFRDLVFADRFQTLIDAAAILSIERHQLLVALLAEQMTGLGLIFGLCGLVWAAVREPSRALPPVALAGATLAFAAVYQVPDVAAFLLPVQIVLAVGAAVTLRVLRVWGGGWSYAFGSVTLAAVVLLLIVAWRPPAAPGLAQAEAEWG
ncbi:MAG TPA: DUF2723 domain-containing protein, partial [Dehalococcoidia bacterium]|nr:DUF2723 domain-containing protein [Dehalococcoidia bacterium]